MARKAAPLCPTGRRAQPGNDRLGPGPGGPSPPGGSARTSESTILRPSLTYSGLHWTFKLENVKLQQMFKFPWPGPVAQPGRPGMIRVNNTETLSDLQRRAECCAVLSRQVPGNTEPRMSDAGRHPASRASRWSQSGAGGNLFA